MGHKYTLFPYLTQDMLDRIRFQGNAYLFNYSDGSTEHELTATVMDGGGSIQSYILGDPVGKWAPNDYNWGFKRTIRLSPGFLFGVNGVAPAGAKLGVAIMWISLSSKQRGVIPVGQFDNSETLISMFANCCFSDAQLCGRVEISTVLYLAETAKSIKPDETHLANTTGTILGELEKIYIILDGTASIFPISEVTDPVQPLWYISCDWENPLIEMFNDTVRLNLNRAHKDFPRIDQSSAIYDLKFMQEIMASALTILMMKVRTSEYWNEIDIGSDFDHGSVAEAVYYFINTLKWQISTPEAASVSIRKFFDKTIS